MAKSKNPTLAQFNKLGYVETDKGLVPVESSKKKVDKIDWLPVTENAYDGSTISRLHQDPADWRGIKIGETFKLPTGAYIDVLYRFDITPCPAPRMVNSDKWRKRKPVVKYFAFKDELVQQANEMGYKLTPVLRMLVLVPMAKSWSNKKRLAMNNQPHQLRPDADNLFKAVADAFGEDDSFIWDARVIKLWGEKGQIIIF